MSDTGPRKPPRVRDAPRHPAAQGIRSSLVGILVNALLAAFKGAAGYLGHSYALVADAIESASDVASSLIVLVGLRVASAPPDDEHPYGHGKAEPLAAVAVALALFVAAANIAVQSLREIRTPHFAPAPFTLVVLVVVILTKELLFRFVFRIGETVSSTAVKTDAWHHRSDAITSLAAFVGISIALIGGEGYQSADDWAALFASLIIAFNGYRLLRPALAEVMDTAPEAGRIAQVREAARAVPGVAGLDKCLVRKMGFDYYVDLHVLVQGETTVRQGHEIAHDVKEAIRRKYPRVTDVLVHIEPAD